MELIKYLAGIGIMAFLSGCSEKKAEPEKDDVSQKIQLLQADKAFSDYCEQKGMKAANIEYIDANGVILRPDALPVVGAHAIDYLIQINDTGYTLKWQPHNAEVSKSGDLGYTYGIYAITPSNIDTQLLGTYLHVWKRQEDGSWKYVANSWNEGVGENY